MATEWHGDPWEGARNPGATRHGVYGYCSCCDTRNDVQELTLTRERIKAGEPLVP